MPGYEQYFVRKWLRSLRKKQAAWPDVYDFTRARAASRSAAHDGGVGEASHTDFPTLEDYLNGYAITGARLAQLEVPSTIFTSRDDPIIPAAGLAALARPPSLTLNVTPYGGHCGFFAALSGPTWLEQRILALLGAGTAPATPAVDAASGVGESP